MLDCVMVPKTRDRLIETTEHLIQHRGHHGMALGDVLETSAAPRGSLYFHFPGGKDELVAEATRRGIAAVTENLRSELAADVSPGRAVRRLLKAAAIALQESDFRFGSPTAPLVLDGFDPRSEISTLISSAYTTWIGQFETAFIAAGIPTQRARSLALIVEASFEGLLVICRAERNIEPMLLAARELESVVDGAIPKGRK
jgi:TetR/AcrR family transcriptional repressor of lmrAB and yxaGH operons